MIRIGLVGYEESLPLKAAIGNVRGAGTMVLLSRWFAGATSIASGMPYFLNGNTDLDAAYLLTAIVATRKAGRR